MADISATTFYRYPPLGVGYLSDVRDDVAAVLFHVP